MKTIGLLGGMSWESTASYYKAINKGIQTEFGGLHSAKICLYSVNFDEIEKLQHTGNWDKTAYILANAAHSVEAGGADFLLLCTNTMHKVADSIQAAISIPFLHIADATAEKLQADNIKRAGLLGTQFTMQQDFYKNRISEKYGMDVIVPNAKDQSLIHQIIYNELCLGIINPKSRKLLLNIINILQSQGAQAIILGCTEIALLVQQSHTEVPLYNTTQIHAEQAVKLAISCI